MRKIFDRPTKEQQVRRDVAGVIREVAKNEPNPKTVDQLEQLARRVVERGVK